MNRLEKLIKKAGNCVGEKLESLDSIRKQRLARKGGKIEKDEWHPLHSILMQHESRYRTRIKYRLPVMKTNRFRDSFVPSLIRVLNDHVSSQ